MEEINSLTWAVEMSQESGIGQEVHRLSGAVEGQLGSEYLAAAYCDETRTLMTSAIRLFGPRKVDRLPLFLCQ